MTKAEALQYYSRKAITSDGHKRDFATTYKSIQSIARLFGQLRASHGETYPCDVLTELTCEMNVYECRR